MVLLERALEETPEGALLQRAAELRQALNLGITITLADILADEYAAILLIEQEQARCEKEKASAAS